MGRDQARAHARTILGDEAFDQAEVAWLAAAREEKLWAADVAPAPGSDRDAPDAGLALAMVTAGEWVLHAEVLAHRPAGPAERARDLAAAVNVAARVVGVYPERVKVPYRDVVEELGREFKDRGVSVEFGETDGMFDAMSSALANMDPSPARGWLTFTHSWRETEASAEELRDFHEAAAAFFAAEPWAMEETDFLLDVPHDSEDAPAPEADAPELRQWAASVMGSLGETFGLMLYSQPLDLANFYASGETSSLFTDRIGFSITVDYDRRSELSRTMQREVAAARWPVAAPHAWPRLFALGLPGRWIRARDVRLATLALRALTAVARGGDPLAQTGVAVTPFDAAEEKDDSRIHWFNDPDEAMPIRAEGPGVEAEPRVGMWDYSLEQHQSCMAAEQERIGRFAGWLREQGVPEEEAGVDLQNANAWTGSVLGAGSPGAVTEFDLRLFLYDIYVRKTDPSPEAVRALPRSMRRIFQWQQEREGVRYPFAGAVLDELEEIAARAREMDEPLEETLRILSYNVYDDLDSRVMLPSSSGWPDMMNIEVAHLRDELQRRWLLWYDELVKDGLTGFRDLEDVLLGRQHEWENTPHPRVGGRTPVEVILEYLE